MFTLHDFFTNGFIGKYFLSNTEDKTAMTLMIIGAAVIMIAAYLLGSINFAIIISSKEYKQDIREFGSKNAGMTNMMRTYGKKAAGLTLLGDALKAVFSCLIGYALLGQLGAYIAGLFCILGHVFPIYYRFKGGKGVVTAAVTVLMCDPFVFLILFTIFVIIVLGTKYISLGSVMCMLLYPIVLDSTTKLATKFGFGEESTSPYIIFTVLMAIIIVAKHWTNIKRLMNGTESKFSFKKSVKTAKAEDTEANEDSKNDKQ